MINIKFTDTLEINGRNITGYRGVEGRTTPLYLAKDVTAAIGIRNTSSFVVRVSEGEKLKAKSPVGDKIVWLLTPKGLNEALAGKGRRYEVGGDNKTCTTCGKIYPKTDEYFYVQNRESGRLNYECKECSKKRANAKSKKQEQIQPDKSKNLTLPINAKEVKLNINGSDVTCLLKDGINLLPLTELIAAVYGDKAYKEMERVRSEASEFTTKVGKRKYVSLMGLPIIMSNCDDKLLVGTIIKKILNLPKIKKDPVDTLYDGIVSMSNINILIKEISDGVHKCDLTKSDILHTLENNDFSDEDMLKTAYELQSLMRERRTLKIRQIILDEQVTALKNMGFKGSSEAGREATRIAKLRAEQQLSKEHKIYFMRDGSNKEEMEAKIQELSA